MLYYLLYYFNPKYNFILEDTIRILRRIFIIFFYFELELLIFLIKSKIFTFNSKISNFFCFCF